MNFFLSTSVKSHSQDTRFIVPISADTIASCSRDGFIKIWHLSPSHGLELEWESKNLCKGISCLELSSNFLLFGTGDGFLGFLDMSSRNVQKILKMHDNSISSIAANSDLILISSWDATSTIVRSDGFTEKLIGHTNSVLCCLIMSSNIFITGSADKTIKVWNNQICTNTLTFHNSCVRSLSFTPSRKLCISCDNDGEIIVWSVSDFVVYFKVYKAHETFIYNVTCIDDDHFITTGEDCFIKIWCISLQKCIKCYGLPSTTNWISIYISGRLLVGSASGNIYIFESLEGANLKDTNALFKDTYHNEYDTILENNQFIDSFLIPSIRGMMKNREIYMVINV